MNIKSWPKDDWCTWHAAGLTPLTKILSRLTSCSPTCRRIHSVFAKRCRDSQDVFTRHVSVVVSAEVLCKHRADSSCGAPRDTGGAVWPQVRVLVQVSQLRDKTWHATQTPQNHRDGRRQRESAEAPVLISIKGRERSNENNHNNY